MEELFDINDLPGFQEAVTAAMAVIHDDIRKRSDVDAARGITIKVAIDPVNLLAASIVKVSLPKQPGFDEKLDAVYLIRENGALKVPVPEPVFDL
jgi:hypothetical protein